MNRCFSDGRSLGITALEDKGIKGISGRAIAAGTAVPGTETPNSGLWFTLEFMIPALRVELVPVENFLRGVH